MPHLVSYEDSIAYDTIVSAFENGMTQRRSRFGRPIRRWKFNYNPNLLSQDGVRKLQDEILEFFKRMKGKYDNFWLPSWELEAKAVSTTANTITLNSDASKFGFCSGEGVYGNYLYICNHPYIGYETTNHYQAVTQVTNVDDTVISVSPAIDHVHMGAGSLVMKCCKAYFASDELTRGYDTPHVWKADIEILEDVADMYQLGTNWS